MGGSYRYKAFISYSHLDRHWGRWLLRAIETYRVPKRLVGRKTGRGVVIRRLAPIFHDRHELPAAEDLAGEVRRALRLSEFLIVVCSPRSAASRWVNTEILEFKRLRGEKNLLAVVVDGDPFASEKGRESEECFPPALRRRIGPDGELTEHRAEPAAADLRPDGDGRRVARLKLVAGMTGLRLDDLLQRDLLRRQRRVTAVTVGALLGMLAMGALTLEAMDARRTAEQRRVEAEELVEFMLTDLRKKLEPVGRLDVLDAVGEKAVGYYASQRLEELPADSIGRRARAYQLLGEIDELKGDLTDAEEMFRMAWDDTSALLTRHPADPRRIFDHAQSVYWLGYLDWRRGQYEDAGAAFRLYKDLAEKLVAIEPENADYMQEVAFAHTNLGVLQLQFDRPQEALTAFRRVLEFRTELAAQRPNDRALLKHLANTHAWIADAIRVVGHLADARRHRLAELEIYEGILADHPDDFAMRDERLQGQLALASLNLDMGEPGKAADVLRSAIRDAEELASHDPENANWLRQAGLFYVNLAELYAATEDLDRAEEALSEVFSLETKLQERGALSGIWKIQISYRRELATAYLYSIQSNKYSAQKIIEALLPIISSQNGDGRILSRLSYLKARAHWLLGEIFYDSGRKSLAEEHWNYVVEQVTAQGRTIGPMSADLLMRAYERLGREGEAQKLAEELLSNGYAAPDFLAFRSEEMRAKSAAAE